MSRSGSSIVQLHPQIKLFKGKETMRGCETMPKRGKYESFYHATDEEKMKVDKEIKKLREDVNKKAQKGILG